MFTQTIFKQFSKKKPAAANQAAIAKQIASQINFGRPGNTLKMGIVGMANVGKSLTFNLLCKQSVPSENFPFCTIDPNTAIVKVPDSRFEYLVKAFKPASQVEAHLQITDIAGLVKGASEGHGLGNEFLSHISEVDGIYQVVRAFEGENILHTEGSMDPVRDLDIISKELIAKDLQFVDKKLGQISTKAARSGNPEMKQQVEVLTKAKDHLINHRWIRFQKWDDKDVEVLNKLLLLTTKPVTYLINLSKKDYLEQNCKFIPSIADWIKEKGGDSQIIQYSGVYEKEIEDKPELLNTSQLKNIILNGYSLLNMCHFFTVGTDEVRAWTIKKNSTAPKAASVIHTDFEKGFISAEVLSYKEFEGFGSNGVEKLKKSFRKEGKDYIVQDGDIVHFKCKIVR
ncbi:GTP-binding protein YchF (macronuclear) [Tetrahymena thermophila SB210]|uniref:Obg-like ATPase homolog n=1 Tax=Tetrahymena thermophila (strain SB210) TaxID=312017 RepID=I7LUN5_TETTS|nr:GTP-binding protein YchF [Tetrahymena thermophila SB210]EAR95036.2 GTP-binding protein YchF [Tetrahymena thermophila SB210]|eukprot:XP_001015281.2 GTP-binding protein YchF [Tetrahymena thermophila SB210]